MLFPQVKCPNSFKEGKKQGIYSEICEEVIRPSAEECSRNPRAKSTKMRWAVRADYKKNDK